MSAVTLFRGGPIVLADRVLENGRVLVRDGRIAAVETNRRAPPAGATVIELQGNILSPGLVDLHVHGGGGADFMDGTTEAVRTVCRTHLRHGTTTIFPTTTTGSPEQLQAMFQACQEVQQSPGDGDAARIAGIHLYGPYFAPRKSAATTSPGSVRLILQSTPGTSRPGSCGSQHALRNCREQRRSIERRDGTAAW